MINYIITFGVALVAYCLGAIVHHRANIDDIACTNEGKIQSCLIYQKGENMPIYNFETTLKD